jgi:hypothetical protein
MVADLEKNLGPQPIEQIMAEHKLKTHDLVAASTDQLTHKKIAHAMKGRRLTPRMKFKILNALNHATKKTYALKDLFNYGAPKASSAVLEKGEHPPKQH